MDALTLFAEAAGIAPEYLSLIIRTVLLSSFFIWSAWCVMAIMSYYKHHRQDNLSHLFNDYIQLFFLISIMVALVFI